jgi:hypothetical protein
LERGRFRNAMKRFSRKGGRPVRRIIEAPF